MPKVNEKNIIFRKTAIANPLELKGCQLWLDASNEKDGGVKSGNAAQFASATNESLSITDAAQSGLDPLLGDFAVAGWLYADTLTSKTMLAKGATTDVNPNSIGFYVNINASDQLSAFFGDGTAARISTAGSTTLSTGTWYFATWNFDRDGNVTIRLNDTSEGAGTDISAQQGSLNSTDPFVIGAKSGLTLYFNGRLQNWIVLNRLLTASEITWLYNAGSGRRFEDFGQAGNDGADLTVAGGIVSGWKLREESGQRNDYFAANHLTDNNTVTQNDGVALVDAVDGDYVRQWTDLSGNGWDATQTGNVTTKPIFRAGAQNGKPGIRFDGTDDFLDIASNETFLNTSNATVFIVGKFHASAVARDTFLSWARSVNSMSSGVGAQAHWFLLLDSSPEKLNMRVQNGNTAIDATDTGAPTLNQYYILGYKTEGTNLTFYRDGASIATATGTSLTTLTPEWMRLGRRTDGTDYLQGDIAVAVIYNRALSAGEMARLTRWIGRKWAIAVS